MTSEQPRRRITIAILALGGQGGGVLADWLVKLGTDNGYYVQSTSVPGVAQRTGSTVYYLELFPESDVAGDTQPVLAQMPVPGDVDLVVASELMEGGRAVLRGFVSSTRTTLITSTHRIYAISEKSAMASGFANGDKIIDAAARKSKRLIAFDMEEATARTGSVISSVMLGAIAGSGVLPFGAHAFEQVICDANIAVATNLAGFRAGIEEAGKPRRVAGAADTPPPVPTTVAGKALAARIVAELPEAAHRFALEGVRRLMDYQDAAYASLYLDRLRDLSAYDGPLGDWALTREAARYLALWMSYEDTIRVADLKIRATRIARVRDEVKAAPDQLLHVTEYMHPRLEEVCETLPVRLGERILGSTRIRRVLAPLFRSGRHITTTKTRWFILLWMLASYRRWRRGTLRYKLEQQRIGAWLAMVSDAARRDYRLALELVECARMIKGYSDTHARGLRNFGLVVGAYEQSRNEADAAALVRRLREAALKDEDGAELSRELGSLAA